MQTATQRPPRDLAVRWATAVTEASAPFSTHTTPAGDTWELRGDSQLACTALNHARVGGSVKRTEIVDPTHLPGWKLSDIRVGIATRVLV